MGTIGGQSVERLRGIPGIGRNKWDPLFVTFYCVSCFVCNVGGVVIDLDREQIGVSLILIVIIIGNLSC